MQSAFSALITRLEAIGEVDGLARKTLSELPAQKRTFTKGSEIVADGNVSTSCCLVVEGYAFRSKSLPNGNRQIFSLHTSGDIPDLHSLYLPKMDHSLGAISDCTVATIPHEAIKEALVRAPSLVGLLWRDTLIDAAAFRAWMLMLGQAEAISRMAHLFCELYTRQSMAGLTDNNRFFLPLTQTDLGDILGISVVHANRTLQDLRGRGLLDIEQRHVSILKWQQLRQLGQFDPSYLHYLDRSVGRADPANY
jgi:CRP-like cAMP-binding protein